MVESGGGEVLALGAWREDGCRAVLSDELRHARSPALVAVLALGAWREDGCRTVWADELRQAAPLR